MKKLIAVILVLLTFFAGCEPELKRVETTPPPVNPDRLKCAACSGLKVLKTRVNGADISQGCPICLGLGYRDLKLPPHKILCPDCNGMGSTMDRDRGKSAITSPSLLSGTSAKTGSPQNPFGVKVRCEKCLGTGGIAEPKK